MRPGADFHLARAVFFRLLGVVFLAAFGSLLGQVRGLAGQGGIAPAVELLAQAREALGPLAPWRLPTLFWLSASDGALRGACAAGVVLSLLLMLGVAPRWALLALWALFLSVVGVCGPFLPFQWDALLLETALLSAFLAPPGLLRPRWDAHAGTGARWLLRGLLVRLMVLAGWVKLASGDEAWRSLTALEFHYWTQPLPHVLGYLAHQLPAGVQRASVVVMLLLELVAPLLLMGPRRVRHLAAAGLALLQVLIAATGNYGYFNLLTLALVLLNVDDAVWARVLPPRLRARWGPAPGTPRAGGEGARLARLVAAWGAAAAYALAAAGATWQSALRSPAPAPLAQAHAAAAPFHAANGYGLFAVMTTTRDEVVLEGSADGETWRRYRLPYRPEGAHERPRYAFLHMPRLDWQLWFAALGDCRSNPWLLSLQERLLQGAPAVVPLFEEVPFPSEAPPRYVRTRREALRFTSLAELRRTGAWWTREDAGPYCPVLTLEEGQLVAVPGLTR